MNYEEIIPRPFFVVGDFYSLKVLVKRKYPYMALSFIVTSKLRKHLDMLRNFRLVLIDCGAFGIMSKKKVDSFLSRKYMYEYMSFILWLKNVKNMNNFLFVSMDLPCEPTVQGPPVEERIKITVENAAKFMEFAEKHDLKKNLVTVIQGYKLHHYHTCLDMLKERGLLTDIVGIGSLCIRNNPDDVRKIVWSLWKRLGGHKIHTFGISVKELDAIKKFIYSFDSHAWARGPTGHGTVYLLSKDGGLMTVKARELGLDPGKDMEKMMEVCFDSYIRRILKILRRRENPLDVFLRKTEKIITI